MKTLKAKLCISLLVLVAACASDAPRPAEAEKAAAATPFPMPARGITVSAGGKATNLAELLDEFTRASGWNVIVSPEQRTYMAERSCGVEKTIQVPAAELYGFVETCLVHNDLAWNIVSAHEPRILALRPTSGPGAASLRSHAVFVEPEALPAWREHAAVLVQTLVPIEHGDARALANSLRSTLTDENTQQIVALGGTNVILVYGFAPWVAATRGMLVESDRSTAAAQVAPAAAAK